MNLRDDNKLFLLCISNGNAEGLGREREKELEKSCRFLKFAEAPTTINDPDLQDGMDNDWSPDLVAEHVNKYLIAMAREGKDHEINTIITYDEYGVSYHPNHIAVHRGVCKMFENHQFELELYTLTTVNMFRKYTSYFDIAVCDQWEYHLFTWNFA